MNALDAASGCCIELTASSVSRGLRPGIDDAKGRSSTNPQKQI
jgi:hypothetical protein